MNFFIAAWQKSLYQRNSSIASSGTTVKYRFFEPPIGKLNLVRNIAGKYLIEANPTFVSKYREFRKFYFFCLFSRRHLSYISLSAARSRRRPCFQNIDCFNFHFWRQTRRTRSRLTQRPCRS